MKRLKRWYRKVRNWLSGAVIVQCPKCGKLHRVNECKKCDQPIFYIDPSLDVQSCDCGRVFHKNGSLLCGSHCDGLMRLPKINRPIRKWFYVHKDACSCLFIVILLVTLFCLIWHNTEMDNVYHLDKQIGEYSQEKENDLASLTFSFAFNRLTDYDRGYLLAMKDNGKFDDEDVIEYCISKLLLTDKHYYFVVDQESKIAVFDLLKQQDDPLWHIENLRNEISSLRSLRDELDKTFDCDSASAKFEDKKQKIKKLFDKIKF